MTGIKIDVDRNALRRAKQHVKRTAERAANPAPVWPSVGTYLSHANWKQFTSRGAYYGTPWKPLKPNYYRWKLKSGHGRTMLVLTGKMRTSFTARPMAIEVYSRHHAVFGSDDRLAIFHQFGTRRNGKRAIPARPMMVVTPKVRDDIADIIEQYVTTGRVSSYKTRL